MLVDIEVLPTTGSVIVGDTSAVQVGVVISQQFRLGTGAAESASGLISPVLFTDSGKSFAPARYDYGRGAAYYQKTTPLGDVFIYRFENVPLDQDLYFSTAFEARQIRLNGQVVNLPIETEEVETPTEEPQINATTQASSLATTTRGVDLPLMALLALLLLKKF